tara:strand:+ start:564 stop:803 length:240 start_codon:yes stop_codon:yes gene_type:complete
MSAMSEEQKAVNAVAKAVQSAEIHMVGGNTPGSLGPAYNKPAKGGSNGKGIADGIHAKDAAKEAEKAAKKAAKSLKKFF